MPRPHKKKSEEPRDKEGPAQKKIKLELDLTVGTADDDAPSATSVIRATLSTIEKIDKNTGSILQEPRIIPPKTEAYAIQAVSPDTYVPEQVKSEKARELPAVHQLRVPQASLWGIPLELQIGIVNCVRLSCFQQRI